MNEISSWLLSIAGIVLLGVLTEFVLPDGQMNKFVKVVFSFVTLFVIIMPLPKLLGKTYELESYFAEQPIQEHYLEQVNLDQLNALTKQLNEEVCSAGLKNVEISLGGDIFGERLKIYKVTVDLREIEYENSIENKNIENAKSIVLKQISKHSILEGVEVKFYE